MGEEPTLRLSALQKPTLSLAGHIGFPKPSGLGKADGRPSLCEEPVLRLSALQKAHAVAWLVTSDFQSRQALARPTAARACARSLRGA